MEDILHNVLNRITPTEEQKKKLSSEVDAFIKRLSPNVDAEVTVGGSYAKDSFLADLKDIDIYVRFDKDRFKDEDISGILHQALKKTYKDIAVLHGSRDYFQVKNGIIFEIVPIIAIDNAEEAYNITDISPLHVRWVKANCKDPDQIRLMKAFAKAQGFYGAESYIMGFSGYALEILVSIYGGFIETLREASKWKEKVIIDPEKQHRDVMFEVNSSKTKSPVVLIDPVEAGRNTTASLSKEKMDLFVRKAKEFLSSPDESFFEMVEPTLDSLKLKAGRNRLVVAKVFNFEGKEDVEGCRILKVHHHILQRLNDNGFTLLKHGWNWNKVDEAILWYIIDPAPLSRTYVRRGPPVKAKVNAQKFRDKYPGHYEENGRLFAEVDRDFLEADGLIRDALEDEYVTERIRSSEVIHP